MSETQLQTNELDRGAPGDVRAGAWAVSSAYVLAGIAAAAVLLHLAGIRHYGFFRDELYYMACGEHLAWGYVDQPPLIALFAWISHHLLGNTIVSLRMIVQSTATRLLKPRPSSS